MATTRRTRVYTQTAIRSSCTEATFPVATVSEPRWTSLLLPGTPSGGHQLDTTRDTTRNTSGSTSQGYYRGRTKAPAGGRDTGTGVPTTPTRPVPPLPTPGTPPAPPLVPGTVTAAAPRTRTVSRPPGGRFLILPVAISTQDNNSSWRLSLAGPGTLKVTSATRVSETRFPTLSSPCKSHYSCPD